MPIRTTTSSFDALDQYWKNGAPQWVQDLAKACDKHSQKYMATKIGKSPALINLVLKDKYPGRVDLVKADVERVLEAKPVECPILGMIQADVCLHNQNLPFRSGNHQQVALFRACRKCPHNSKNKGGSNA